MRVIEEIREEPKFVVELTEREIQVLLASVSKITNPQIRDTLKSYNININIDGDKNDIALFLYRQLKGMLHIYD